MRNRTNGSSAEIDTQDAVRDIAKLDRFDGALSHRVYQSLREAILTLHLAPGRKLNKQDLCDHLGVSRSPVSEALTKLSAEGLVEIIPQSGTRVTPFSMEDIREGAFVREALEIACASHMAEHGTESELSALQRNLLMQKLLAEENNGDEFYKFDEQFHLLIISSTGYKRIPTVLNSASAQIARVRLQLIPSPGRLNETFEEHQAIVNAIAKRDAAEARRAMRFHVRQLYPRVEALARERPDLFSRE